MRTIDRRELNLTLPADPRAVAEARQAVETTLEEARPEVCDDVRLLVSELVTNSIRHGGLDESDRVELRMRATPRAVRVEVIDPGKGFDAEVADRPREVGGWGLYLVGKLAERWGVQAREGTRVWFEMDRPFAAA